MVDVVRPLDSDWLRSNPLPQPDDGADKNARGRVLVIGGSRTVPGGIQLTVEAALRAGAGKVQVATIQSAALPIGIAIPEIAVFGLLEGADGEIALSSAEPIEDLLAGSDAVVAGPAMGNVAAASAVTTHVLSKYEADLVLDAGTLMDLGKHAGRLRERKRVPVLTPHIGELAAMLACDAATIEDDRLAAVQAASQQYNAICVLKGPKTLIAAPENVLFAYAGGGVGLATGGSGDVLAGIVAGLCARGADPLEAALWAVWLHGEAGRRCSEQVGPLGFLARDLLALIPGLMRGF